jgi:carbamoyl-phosphate synthase large subunit
MKKNNILILSAGRRVELVKAFKTELAQLIPSSRVIAVDLNPSLSAACHIADEHYKAPNVTSDEYIPFLKKLCIEKSVSIIIPTIDSELLVLSTYREDFKNFGTNVIISEVSLVKACRNKNELLKIFHEMELDTPLIYNKDDLSFPCFVKPYDGSSSNGAYALIDKSMLSDKILNDTKNMFMELIPPYYDEYSIDAYYDRNGKLKSFVPRLRIETRSGEISKGVTNNNFVYEYLLNKLPNLIGARGCITLQMLVCKKENSLKAIEINPRFGGGYPLSYSAGANYPKMLIREYLLDEQIDFFDSWEINLLMLRYDAKILLNDYKS